MEKQMIEVKELTLAYPDGTVGIRNANFVVKDGETVALIGANGAGKSTLLLGIVGMLPRVFGQLYLNQIPVTDKDLTGLRRAVGMVFQNPDDQLFMASIKEDLAFGPLNYGISEEETAKRVDCALQLLGIEMLADKMPHKLSGGEKRLAAIGTVLVMEPELILLDEPSSFLDPKARRNLIAVLSKIPGAKLIATHDLDLAMDLCERVIILKNGEILADGPAKEILCDKELLEGAGLELPLGLSEQIEKK
ncbi:MAG: ABC transporter ATP-binding protein [Eubacteriales bacterium]|nr:ABC transporter ATP-binding protein [Eubacteriales bacterium]